MERIVLSDVRSLPQQITAAALVFVAAVSWVLLARSAAVMSAMEGEGVLLDVARAMMQPASTAPYLLVTSLMWMVMMGAMMTPAILPVVLLFQRLDRRGDTSARGGAGRAGTSHGLLFVSGYLLVWLGFALVAAVLQWGLHRAALLHAHVLAAGPLLAGSMLLVAGVYQLTPLKRACLKHCQSPLAFLLGHWEDGARGALRMGMRHGAYCLGCCWALMLLMFAGGVMSIAAMAVLSVFILAERLLPARGWVATVPGVVLIGWGVWTIVQA